MPPDRRSVPLGGCGYLDRSSTPASFGSGCCALRCRADPAIPARSRWPRGFSAASEMKVARATHSKTVSFSPRRKVRVRAGVERPTRRHSSTEWRLPPSAESPATPSPAVWARSTNPPPGAPGWAMAQARIRQMSHFTRNMGDLGHLTAGGRGCPLLSPSIGRLNVLNKSERFWTVAKDGQRAPPHVTGPFCATGRVRVRRGIGEETKRLGRRWCGTFETFWERFWRSRGNNRRDAAVRRLSNTMTNVP